MLKVCGLGLAVCAVSGAVRAVGVADNLIQNGDMQSFTLEAPTRPVRWTIGPAHGATVKSQVDGETGADDVWAQLSTTTEKGSSIVLRCAEVGLQPGARYRLGFSFRGGEGPSAMVRVRMFSNLGDRDPSLAVAESKTLGALWLPIKGGRIGSVEGAKAVVTEVPGKNGWTRVTIEFDALWDAVAGDVRIAVQGGGRAGDFGFDNFELVPVPR